MLVTTILAMALTTQAAKAQAPLTEQQRLKALATKIHRETLAKKPQVKPKPKPVAPEPAPIIQYVEVPEAKPGSILYVWSQDLSRVPFNTYLSDAWRLQPLILADDEKSIEETQTARREPLVPNGTAVKVLQLERGTSTLAKVCEVRILDGPFKDQKGWVLEYLLRERVEINLKKTKRHR